MTQDALGINNLTKLKIKKVRENTNLHKYPQTTACISQNCNASTVPTKQTSPDLKLQNVPFYSPFPNPTNNTDRSIHGLFP